MRILVIDGQGGGIGRSIVERLMARISGAEIIAVGTNSAATANMIRGTGARGATGENAILYNCAHADVVIGPVGIYFANAMLGEVSPAMAAALSSCGAEKFAIPVSRCQIHIAGLAESAPGALIDEAVESILALKK
ncbi:MAG: DUF3842 family protein [Christensenellaceae bacterium]|nr:DUF3842 family protein [Christensenellaceae bacterium]